MKIALPTNNGLVEGHFGQCSTYTLVTVNEEKEIVKVDTMDSPQGCGCKSNIAGILREEGVSTMLAGNMGEGALQVLNRNGIEVFRGCSGRVTDVVNAWLSGAISDSGIGCSHHEHHGGHEHH